MAYTFAPAFPTPQHARAAQVIQGYFAGRPGVSAVLLTCSCARGKASRDSCLDINILIPQRSPAERAKIEQKWEAFQDEEPAFQELKQVGAFSHVDLEFSDGRFDPAQFDHGWTSGADEFELAVGNLLAYSVPLWEGDSSFRDLKANWLPYYDENLRRERQEMVLKYCRNNLAHIPLYVGRGLYFQALKRLHHAFEEFLQALFITRRTYPIAYDKWVREQIVEILELPELYPQLVSLLEISRLESDQLAQKAQEMEGFIQAYIHTW